jgi:ABC-type transport system involved in cytochrome c biogenesis permease component
MAPLQKRSWYSFAIGLVFTIAITIVFVVKGGIATFNEDQSYRIIVNVLWIGALLASLLMTSITFRKPRQLDERDKLIMVKAQKIQLYAILFSLAAWVVALPEIYHTEGQIPVAFIYLIYMSVLLVMTLSQSIGVLIGYWRGVSHD